MADSAKPFTPISPLKGDYRVDFDAYPQRVAVEFNGVKVADSTHAMIMRETRLSPVYYFPRNDVRMDLLNRTRHHSYCPFRGSASYWTLKVGEQVAENAVWSYEAPNPEATSVKDYLAFYQDRMNTVFEADLAVSAEPTEAPSGYPNSLVDWLLRDAWHASSTRELVTQLGEALHSADIPVSRLWLTVRTMHPLLMSTRYAWSEGSNDVEEQAMSYGVLEDSRFLESPLKPIFEGAGGVRRRLEGPNPQLDFPIVRDLHADRATDYVAMPFVFSDGQVNAISLTTRRAGGFSTENLGHIYEILPLLSRLFEVHTARLNAANLLGTYLGRQSGKKVLNGLIKRGDGETIHSVIWFCDLRESTPLADSMPRGEFLDLLNRYFECMAGPVLEKRGEVLRFIGDAVLAIFPIDESAQKDSADCKLIQATCETALAAASDARTRIEALNIERSAGGQRPLGYGIGLHVGDVMYGNIGTPERLEFTVIGSAANEAARIESLCKTLGRSILTSSQFARYVPRQLESIGFHTLRGVASNQELFTLV
jgi:adenylate cyclase